jgi:hypothetical protein
VALKWLFPYIHLSLPPHPLQVLHTRPRDAPLLSAASAARQLVRTAGLGGLWRGAPVRTLEVAAGGVIFFSVLEGVHRLLPMH